MTSFVHLRDQRDLPVEGDRHLIWTRGMRGPTPQILVTEPGKTPMKPADALSTPRRLSERHARLSVRAIAELHPAPPPKPEDL